MVAGRVEPKAHPEGLRLAAIGVFITARPALADIGLKRRLETAKRFTELAERATNMEGNVGTAELLQRLHELAGLLQHEPGHMMAHMGVGSDLADLLRANLAEIGIIPAHQGLEADRLAGQE